jgi:hypothetical protein
LGTNDLNIGTVAATGGDDIILAPRTVTQLTAHSDTVTPANSYVTVANILNVGGNVNVNTNKFVVTASDGSLNIGPSNFTVAGATGNTHTVGSLQVDGNTTLGDNCSTDTLAVNAVASFNCNTNLGDAAADVITFIGTIAGQYPLVFEGGSSDANQTTFEITNPSTDRTITFPNATITVNAAGDLSGTTLAAGVTFSSLTSVGTLTSGTWQAGVIGDSWIVDALTITGGTITASTIDSTTIGATTRSSGNFTTLNANTSLVIGTAGATTAITRHLSAAQALDFDLSGAGVTTHDLTITVSGAATGDTVVLGIPNAVVSVGVIFSAWVSAADTVTVRAVDWDSSNPNPGSATFRVDVWQH